MKSFKQWCLEGAYNTLLELYENTENELKSNQIAFASSKTVNLKCRKCDMEWKEKLYRVTQRTKKECPYCNHKRPSKKYNVVAEMPILEKEWNYELNSKQPTEYLPNSNKKVWWKCKNGHIWEDTIINRVEAVKRNANKKDSICPYGNCKKISQNYNLLTEFPYIARQWDYINNGSLTPLDVIPKGSQKVWWRCEYNPTHNWQDKIANRTLLYRSCPICSKQFSISFPARVLYYYLKQYFNECEIEYRISNKCILDIFIPYYKIAIEYDGWYYHSSDKTQKVEKEKDKFLKIQGLEVIRVKEKKDYSDKIIYEKNVITYHLKSNYSNLDELIKELLRIIEKKTNCSINLDIDFKRDYPKIENLYYCIRKSNCPFCSNRKVCKENSLAEYSNKFVKEWNYQKNDDLLPENLQNQMLRVAVYSNLIIDNWTERNVSKMRIGIDLDGVVFDSEKEFRVYSELYDMIDLKQNSKINNKEIKFQDRFKWTQEETDNFISKYHKQIIEESNFMPGVKRILNLLKGEGHNLIIVTARGGINKDMIKITENILKENNLDIFDKYYWATENKDEVCKKENIDIMVDDSLKQCKSIANSKIRVIYLKDAPSYDIEENEYIKVLYNWGEIYRYIKEMENK